MSSSAAANGSTRRIMPGPPPQGVSSTERCRPGAKSRGFVRSIRTRPAVMARPSRLVAKKPSSISGNSVTSSKVISGARSDIFAPDDIDATLGQIDGPNEFRQGGDEKLGLALHDEDVLGTIPHQ